MPCVRARTRSERGGAPSGREARSGSSAAEALAVGRGDRPRRAKCGPARRARRPRMMQSDSRACPRAEGPTTGNRAPRPACRFAALRMLLQVSPRRAGSRGGRVHAVRDDGDRAIVGPGSQRLRLCGGPGREARSRAGDDGARARAGRREGHAVQGCAAVRCVQGSPPLAVCLTSFLRAVVGGRQRLLWRSRD
jgi:hypothetical protein